jgi:hypothetical protein
MLQATFVSSDLQPVIDLCGCAIVWRLQDSRAQYEPYWTLSTDASAETEAAAEPQPIEHGSVVRISGLTHRPTLNGKHGRLYIAFSDHMTSMRSMAEAISSDGLDALEEAFSWDVAGVDTETKRLLKEGNVITALRESAAGCAQAHHTGTPDLFGQRLDWLNACRDGLMVRHAAQECAP